LVAVPVFVEAWQSLRRPSLHGITDRLVALALIAAWATGDLMTAALLPIIMTIGHVLEERSMLGSHEAVRALSRLTEADCRRLLPDGSFETVPSALLRVGDRIELRAGERVPADGTVRRGHSSLDLASLTGESVPVDVGEGDQVLAGGMNIDGLLHVELTRVGEESTVGRIIALMREAENAKPPVTRLLDRYAGQYMALVLLVAAGTWLLTGNVPAMLAVLVASCPCALVLAAPSTAVAAIAVAARHGILIKGSAFLEHLADVSSVIFDKTGTLTTGELRLDDVRAVAGDPQGVRRLGASLGAASNHPLSRAVAAAVPKEERLALEDTRELGGFGVMGRYEGQEAALGRADLFRRLGIDVPPLPAHNGPIAGVSLGGTFLGWLLFFDQLRSTAAPALQDLRSLGIEHMVLLTGDRLAVAKQVASEVGIDDVYAEMLPEQKMDRVMQEIRAGHRPMVVGDGINDSLALRAGAVGVAMGAQGAGDVAFASADLALMTNDLRRLGTCIRLSRRCRWTIYVNVAIGVGFTFGLIILAGWGVLGVEAPIIAALLHNVSTFIGLGNAGRLLLFDETQQGTSTPAASAEIRQPVSLPITA
ncbi:MAG: heavy metal translocating P-type ATPase, partial [Steroidobacteraceae bacterium]